jgi:DMSO/TMAO reductase YedYZ molybdopterin-dependent catalytic subunit
MNRESVSEDVSSRMAEAEDKSLDVDGIEPLVSENFFRTDINNTVPTPDVEGWELSVTGAVQFEQSYDFANLGSFDPQHRFVSLRCVGENLNGNRMDNAIWTGVPIEPLLDRANPRGDFVMGHAVDGYSVGFPREELEGAFLAYGMNGERLPRKHGYPVRLLVPGNWGEVNVKWIDELEIQNEEEDGYWEKKGWEGTGEVKTVAKIKTVNRVDGRVQVGGHAYAGTRGVRAVEVSVGGGEWQEATLSDPLPGQDVWRQWKYEFDDDGGNPEVVARAIEEDGTIQPDDETGPFPTGPSGWVSRTV